jgi:hypothetical protein
VSEAELDGLERDVIEARRRFDRDLRQVRSPATAQRVKDELIGYKNELVEQVVDRGVASGKEKIHGVVDDLKQRAIANPAAALSIGAGIAWHLFRKPPITSALIGLGLFGLFRTPPAPPNTDVRDTLREQAGAAARYAGEVGQDLGARISAAVQDKVDQAREAGNHAATQALHAAERAMSDASAAIDRVPPEKIDEARDQVLLGAAALSVTAAVAVAMTRNNKEKEYAD